jgi:hypothetical protein
MGGVSIRKDADTVEMDDNGKGTNVLNAAELYT